MKSFTDIITYLKHPQLEAFLIRSLAEEIQLLCKASILRPVNSEELEFEVPAQSSITQEAIRFSLKNHLGTFDPLLIKAAHSVNMNHLGIALPLDPQKVFEALPARSFSSEFELIKEDLLNKLKLSTTTHPYFYLYGDQAETSSSTFEEFETNNPDSKPYSLEAYNMQVVPESFLLKLQWALLVSNLYKIGSNLFEDAGDILLCTIERCATDPTFVISTSLPEETFAPSGLLDPKRPIFDPNKMVNTDLVPSLTVNSDAASGQISNDFYTCYATQRIHQFRWIVKL